MNYQLLHGDNREQLKHLADNSIDSIVCDPPYELGFMGKRWDSTGIAYDLTVWSECLRVLKPGDHLIAFGGTRTYHRMTVAIEDAGFEIRDCLSWNFGSGFPKSLNLKGEWQGWGTSTKPAYEPAILAYKPHDTEHGIIIANLEKLEAQLWLMQFALTAEWNSTSNQHGLSEVLSIAQWTADDVTHTLGDLCAQMDTSQCAEVMALSLSIVQSWKRTWAEASKHGNTFITETVLSPIIGWTTLKSSLSQITPKFIIKASTDRATTWQHATSAELPFIVASKKLKSTLELIAVESAISRACNPASVDNRIAHEPAVLARKPLIGTVADNVTTWGVGGLNIDGCRVWTTDNLNGGSYGNTSRDVDQYFAGKKPGGAGQFVQPSGRWPANVILDESAGEALDAQSGWSRSTNRVGKRSGKPSGTYGEYVGQDEVSMGHSDSGGASRFFYTAKASKAEREAGLDASDARANHHPTVKPIALMRYLVRLVTPKDGTVLDPFMGSGSTGCAAMCEGINFVGIELSEEYLEIARRRIEYWQSQNPMGL